MKDAMNDTDVLEEINSKLSRLLRLTVVSTQSLEDKLKKSKPYLEGNQFSMAEEYVRTAVSAKDSICEEIKKAQDYVLDLKDLVIEYSNLQF